MDATSHNTAYCEYLNAKRALDNHDGKCDSPESSERMLEEVNEAYGRLSAEEKAAVDEDLEREFRYNVRGDGQGLVVAINLTKKDEYRLVLADMLFQELVAAIPFEHTINRGPMVWTIADRRHDRVSVMAVEMSVFVEQQVILANIKMLENVGFTHGTLAPMYVYF